MPQLLLFVFCSDMFQLLAVKLSRVVVFDTLTFLGVYLTAFLKLSAGLLKYRVEIPETLWRSHYICIRNCLTIKSETHGKLHLTPPPFFFYLEQEARTQTGFFTDFMEKSDKAEMR